MSEPCPIHLLLLHKGIPQLLLLLILPSRCLFVQIQNFRSHPCKGTQLVLSSSAAVMQMEPAQPWGGEVGPFPAQRMSSLYPKLTVQVMEELMLK